MRWMILLTSTLVACGSDDGADKSDVDSYCVSNCAWRARCDNKDDMAEKECVALCVKEAESTNYEKFRSSAVQEMTECYRTRDDCRGDDLCWNQAVNAMAPDPEEDATYKGCIKAMESCTPEPFDDDDCSRLLIFVTPVQEEFEACYAEPCNKRGDCLDRVSAIVD